MDAGTAMYLTALAIRLLDLAALFLSLLATASCPFFAPSGARS
jgi:hypothetical protein